MDIIWPLILVALVIGSIWFLRPFRRGTSIFIWPWFDDRRGDRAQQAYIAEEEIRRSQEEPRDRDLAP